MRKNDSNAIPFAKIKDSRVPESHRFFIDFGIDLGRIFVYFYIVFTLFCSALVFTTIFIKLLNEIWDPLGTWFGPGAPRAASNSRKRQSAGFPDPRLCDAGHTGAAQDTLWFATGEHFHRFLSISACPWDEFVPFLSIFLNERTVKTNVPRFSFCCAHQHHLLTNVIKYTSFNMVQARMSFNHLARAFSAAL